MLQRAQQRHGVAGIADCGEPQQAYASGRLGEWEHRDDGTRLMGRDWELGSGVKRVAVAGGAMLYDASRAGNFEESWFDPRWWQDRGAVEGSATGRGRALFVREADTSYVLRPYRRGGLVARLVSERYWWTGEESTRPFAEWALTHHLHRAGLPVPAPVAARYRRHGYTYSGELITARLLGTRPLSKLLGIGALSLQAWIEIGRCIGRFHQRGVFHADLNAHNLLLTDEGEVFLIDFDRGALRSPGLWEDSNLVRLRRSLEKVTERLDPDRFTEQDWHSLLDGYHDARRVPLAA
jgi:3-deoxy-D-manno-octulosonic acid kinase